MQQHSNTYKFLRKPLQPLLRHPVPQLSSRTQHLLPYIILAFAEFQRKIVGPLIARDILLARLTELVRFRGGGRAGAAGAGKPVRREFIAPLVDWEEWVAVGIEDFFPSFDVADGEKLIGKRGDGEFLANVRNTTVFSGDS